MEYGETILHSLKGQKELEKQLAFGFATKKNNRPYLVDFAADGIKLVLELEDFDRYGVLFTKLDVTDDTKPEGPAADDRFAKRARRLVEELSCLSGPFRVIEKSDLDSVAVLRTEPAPQPAPSFFEFLLDADGTATLRHFTIRPGSRTRFPSAANVSMEAFLRALNQIIEIFRVTA